jgi:hypothetical protein
MLAGLGTLDVTLNLGGESLAPLCHYQLDSLAVPSVQMALWKVVR